MASIWDFLASLPKRSDVSPEELAARRQGYADLYQSGLLARNRDQMPLSVQGAQATQDFLPVIGDALALGEAGEALSRGELAAAGLLGAGAAIGLVPGAGDALAKPVVAAGRRAADIARRIEVDPNALGSTGGNIRLRPQGADDAPATGIRAYHGSPHSFDKFSMDAIGTGEGAQAYGHGLYFTETPDIARGYRDNVFGAISRGDFSSEAAHKIVNDQLQTFGATPNALDGAIEDLQKSLSSANASNKLFKDQQPRVDALNEAIAFLEKKADTRLMVGNRSVSDLYDSISSRADQMPASRAGAEYDKMAILEDLMLDGDVLGVMQKGADYDPATLAWFEKEVAPKFKRPGSLFEVNINANPEDFLDYDAPLSGQPAWQNIRDRWDETLGDPDIIQERLGVDPEKTKGGQFLYKLGAGVSGNDVGISNQLREAGIPGIKYFDAGSRGAGEGSRNFVVFDENLINIVKKYGIAGAAAMLGVSAMDVEQAMAQGAPQPQPQGLLGGAH